MPAHTKRGKKVSREEIINLRATRRQKMLIDRAVSVTGRNRSDFMLETACREAESLLLDQIYFALPEKQYQKFVELLERPVRENPGLKKLLNAKAPWEE